MVVTLEWVRDNYDTITKDRYIDKEEAIESVKDFFNGKITKEQADAVQDAFNNHTLLPGYVVATSTSNLISIIVSAGATLKVDDIEVI